VLYEHIDWKKGATDRKTGEKTLTLKQFEYRYTPRFIRIAREVQGNTIYHKYLNLPPKGRNNKGLKSALQQMDTNANVNWPLMHLGSAHRYLNREDRAIEAILPTGASNIAKSYRFATRGYETGRGDAIISGELPASDILKQAMGFSPASTRAARDRLALNIRKETGRKERKAGILDKIAYALDPDTPRPELCEEALEEMMAYNRDHPATAIDYRTIERSLKSRATRSAFARITGGMPISDRRALLEIMQSDAEFADSTDWLSSDL
jgi:hypothetical protein